MYKYSRWSTLWDKPSWTYISPFNYIVLVTATSCISQTLPHCTYPRIHFWFPSNVYWNYAYGRWRLVFISSCNIISWRYSTIALPLGYRDSVESVESGGTFGHGPGPGQPTFVPPTIEVQLATTSTFLGFPFFNLFLIKSIKTACCQGGLNTLPSSCQKLKPPSPLYGIPRRPTQPDCLRIAIH